MEIFITLIILCIAGYFLYKNIKNKISGKCDCSSCSHHCPNYKNNNNKDDK